MDSKLIARIVAAAFAGVAITLSVMQLREEQRVEPIAVEAPFAPERGPFVTPLPACPAKSELAAAVPDCQAGLAQKRRRFLGLVQKPRDDLMASPGLTEDR